MKTMFGQALLTFWSNSR